MMSPISPTCFRSSARASSSRTRMPGVKISAKNLSVERRQQTLLSPEFDGVAASIRSDHVAARRKCRHTFPQIKIAPGINVSSKDNMKIPTYISNCFAVPPTEEHWLGAIYNTPFTSQAVNRVWPELCDEFNDRVGTAHNAVMRAIVN